MSNYYPSFNYLGVNSRDKGLVVSHFDADQGETDTFLGMEPIYTESADGSRRLDYGAKFNNVATFKITTIKPDSSDFSVAEVREHLKWLTGSRQNSPLELVEHFSEEFTGNGSATSFQLTNTGICKNLLDYDQVCSYNTSTICEALNENEFRVYTTANTTYAGIHSQILTLKAGITYTFSLDVTNIASGNIHFGFRYTSNNSFATTSTTVTSTGHFINRITPKTNIEVYPAVLVTWSTAAAGDATFKNLQVEISPIDTEYAPYTQANGSNYIFSVSVNGNMLDKNEWTHDSIDGLITLADAPVNKSTIKVAYGRIKYLFIGRMTNAWQYKMDARTISLVFEFTSVSPWAYSAPQIKNVIVNGTRSTTILNKTDDLYGYTSMNVVFKNTTGSSLAIENSTIGETTTVTNIAQNEMITISDNMMITSDKASKVFGNSFNFVFPRLIAGENKLTISGTGSVQFQYVYCIKIGDCAININAMSDPIYDDDGNIQLNTLPWSRIIDTPTTHKGYGITDVYSKEEVDRLIADMQAQLSNVYLSLKSEFSNFYTKTEVDAMFDNVYSKAAVDEMLSNK